MAVTQVPFVAGALLAWSLAAPPGPINALMAQAAASRGFWAGWVYGLGAITGDATMLLLTLLGVGRVVDRFPVLAIVFALVGAVLMMWFAVSAWRTARRSSSVGPDAGSSPQPRESEPRWRAFSKSFVIVTTSPYNWGFWLTAGNGALALFGVTLVLGFFVGILLWTILWTGLAHAGGSRIRRFSEFVSYAAAIVLGLFSVGLLGYAGSQLLPSH